jgi:hypothetical protein
MELVFLEHCFRWVIIEGVLVFVIRVTALSACARLLASQFERLRVFRLEHPESIRFKQIVVCRKRKKSHARGDPKGLIRCCVPATIWILFAFLINGSGNATPSRHLRP